MNRPIKFRLPLYKNGKFIRFEYWGFDTENGRFSGPCCDNFDNPLISAEKNSEQYIGQKDEKDTEIYEGDKIERPDCWPIRTGIVVFKEGKFVGVFPEDKIHKWKAETICFPFKTKVVGHIHEGQK